MLRTVQKKMRMRAKVNIDSKTNLSRLPQRVQWLLIVAMAMGMNYLGYDQVAIAFQTVGSKDNVPSGIEFNRDIRPILADRCYACHGPDKNKRQAELRLDTSLGLLGDGETPGVVAPKDPDESELIRRLESTDDEERMPPPNSKKVVSSQEIELIRRWVEQGATWQGHWSFEPIRRLDAPAVDFAKFESGDSVRRFAETPIDRFVIATLAAKNLQPASPADARTLARRLHLDLLGLPPTTQRVEQFAAEFARDSAAYERLVDEFLASPHFGERMAMWWLDLVRYADSVGYHGDQSVSVSPYRDYVIRAFNQNKPFDDFTREQLAGDLLADPSTEKLIASGYNRLGMMSAEGGVQDKEYLSKYIAERVRNVGGAWLGVTLGCCECHDHKFDPFSQRDFYSMEAFFADIEEKGLYSGANDTGVWGPQIQVPTPEQLVELNRLDEQIRGIQARMANETPEFVAERTAWMSQVVPWVALKPAETKSANGATLTLQADQSILASGTSPDTDVYTLEFTELPTETTAVRLEVLPDDSLPAKGPGRASNGNFVLGELTLSVLPASSSDVLQDIPIAGASATFEQTDSSSDHPLGKFAIESAIDHNESSDSWGWAVGGQTGQGNRAAFVLSKPLTLVAGSRLRIELKQNFKQNPQHTLGRFRIDATSESPPIVAAKNPPQEIEALLVVPAAEQTPEQTQKVVEYYRSISPTLEPVRKELAETTAARKKLNDSIPTTLVTKALEPRVVRVLHRGNWMDETGDVVSPTVPIALGGSSENTSRRLTRLDLADWLVSEKNGLTARALSNRLWKLLFGAGLSANLGDLGSQGDWPSHPELLDWLSSEMIQSDWDMKHLIKTMVMSETYRQASDVSVEAAEHDPFNRWLSHQGRWRLDAEVVRDVILATSGLLNDKIGGPSAKPFQPLGYWAYLNFPQREWETGTGSDVYRRGLYTHWQRQYLHPSLSAFDAPSREECVVDRPRSNTPLQALALLNDPSYVESAKALAARIVSAGGSTDSDRIAWAIGVVLTRPPREGEVDVLLALLAKHRKAFQSDAEAVDKLQKVGPFRPTEKIEPAEWMAWTSVARALLNLHETITRN